MGTIFLIFSEFDRLEAVSGLLCMTRIKLHFPQFRPPYSKATKYSSFFNWKVCVPAYRSCKQTILSVSVLV